MSAEASPANSENGQRTQDLVSLYEFWSDPLLWCANSAGMFSTGGLIIAAEGSADQSGECPRGASCPTEDRGDYRRLCAYRPADWSVGSKRY
jgi:hypothetical protein